MVFYDLVVEALIQNLKIKTYIWTPFRHNLKIYFLFLQFEVFKIGGNFFSNPCNNQNLFIIMNIFILIIKINATINI